MNKSNQNIINFWKSNSGMLTKAVAGLLLLLALYVLAKIVWLWVDYSQPKTVTSTNLRTIKAPSKNKVNVNKIVQMHLFGEANAVAEVEEEVTGETNLSLKLIGVYVDPEEPLSSAIIRSGNNEKVYWIGDNLEGVGSSKVELRKVEPLRVIIRNNGRNETLTLLEQLNKDVLASGEKKDEEADSKTIDKRKDSQLARDLNDIRKKLSQSPQSFNDLAKFQVVTDNTGQVSGFKVAPGKDPRLFSRLGLRRNDVVTSINGQSLNSQAYWTLLDQMQTAESLDITVERNGRPVRLLLNLGTPDLNQPKEERKPDNRDLKIQ
ncbi:type II secretion system protein GspC [Kangiella sp. HZ709]|uniref:type II secretion system protein GspC n=1 Tax=Kangiella sp. HZ709 TaxID=2666328 RepID=UPI0012B0C667|nr:type II secretion system protein GspC [Kangiella sp. HZ709]MRX28215.1 type II secretion system protein GspC [Kangiella sp. HZ709]